MSQTAFADSFTGSIPDQGSNTWGWGKINAPGAMDVLLSKIPGKPSVTVEGELSFCDGGSVTLTAPESADHVWSNGDSTRAITVSKEGMYAVRTISNEGYLSAPSDSVQVSVFEPPQVEIMLNKDAGSAESDSAFLEVADNEAFSYEWYMGEEPLDDTTHRIYIELIGTYRVNVTDEKGCVGSDTLRVRVLSAGSPRISGMRIYPNPTSGTLILDSGLRGPARIRIHDMSGRIVLHKEIILQEEYQLDFRPDRKGTYILHIQQGGKLHRCKILIE